MGAGGDDGGVEGGGDGGAGAWGDGTGFGGELQPGEFVRQEAGGVDAEVGIGAVVVGEGVGDAGGVFGLAEGDVGLDELVIDPVVEVFGLPIDVAEFDVIPLAFGVLDGLVAADVVVDVEAAVGVGEEPNEVGDFVAKAEVVQNEVEVEEDHVAGGLVFGAGLGPEADVTGLGAEGENLVDAGEVVGRAVEVEVEGLVAVGGEAGEDFAGAVAPALPPAAPEAVFEAVFEGEGGGGVVGGVEAAGAGGREGEAGWGGGEGGGGLARGSVEELERGEGGDGGVGRGGFLDGVGEGGVAGVLNSDGLGGGGVFGLGGGEA